MHRPPGGIEPAGAGHRHPQDGAEEIIHQRIRLHKLPAQNLACEESKISSKEIKQLPLERCPVPFYIDRASRHFIEPHTGRQSSSRSRTVWLAPDPGIRPGLPVLLPDRSGPRAGCEFPLFDDQPQVPPQARLLQSFLIDDEIPLRRDVHFLNHHPYPSLDGSTKRKSNPLNLNIAACICWVTQNEARPQKDR